MSLEHGCETFHWNPFYEDPSFIDFSLLGERLRKVRQENGMTQEQVSEILDINQSHLSNMEAGRAHLTLTMLLRLCNLFQVNSDYFLWDQYDSDPLKKELSHDNVEHMLRKLTPTQRSAVVKIAETFIDQPAAK